MHPVTLVTIHSLILTRCFYEIDPSLRPYRSHLHPAAGYDDQLCGHWRYFQNRCLDGGYPCRRWYWCCHLAGVQDVRRWWWNALVVSAPYRKEPDFWRNRARFVWYSSAYWAISSSKPSRCNTARWRSARSSEAFISGSRTSSAIRPSVCIRLFTPTGFPSSYSSGSIRRN